MVLKDYEINSSTFAVIPVKKGHCRIIDQDGSRLIKKDAFSIIKNACNYFGNTFESRHAMTKRLININYKSPMVIEESRSIIFFPTSSPREDECIWLSLNAIKKYLKKEDKTRIIFRDDTYIEIPVSYNIIDNQMARSIILEKELNKRKKCF